MARLLPPLSALKAMPIADATELLHIRAAFAREVELKASLKNGRRNLCRVYQFADELGIPLCEVEDEYFSA